MLDKKTLRRQAKTTRNKCYDDDNGMAARKVAAQIIMLPELDTVKLEDAKVVSGYIPMNSELDCMTILKVLHAAYYPIALPAIGKSDAPLSFNRWDMRSDLVDGPCKTKQSSEAEVVPEVIIAPLLAFDETGARIGYGGGYYDRTIENLRNVNPDLIVIGVAYDGQKVATVPTESYDQSLDMIVTETKTYRFN